METMEDFRKWVNSLSPEEKERIRQFVDKYFANKKENKTNERKNL